MDLLSYRYVLEFEPEYDVDEVIASLEFDMNNYIASRLLPCAASTGDGLTRRQLQEDVGLVALDSLPEDQVSTTGTEIEW